MPLGASRQRVDGFGASRAAAGRRGASERRGRRSDCMCHNISPQPQSIHLVLCEPFKE